MTTKPPTGCSFWYSDIAPLQSLAPSPDSALSQLCNSIERLVDSRSFLQFILPVRWAENRQFCSFVRSINEQLESRPRIITEGNDDERRIITWLCALLKTEMGWANDRFVASDPLGIVLWSHRDALDAEEVCMDIEEAFDIDLSDPVSCAPSDSVIKRFATLGDFVKFLAACKQVKVDHASHDDNEV